MWRLLAFVLIMLFAATHAVAAPMAICRHASADAHASALRSADSATAGQAQHEEHAAATAKHGAPAHAAANAMTIAILPAAPPLPMLVELGLAPWPLVQPLLAGRTDQPPSPPPLA